MFYRVHVIPDVRRKGTSAQPNNEKLVTVAIAARPHQSQGGHHGLVVIKTEHTPLPFLPFGCVKKKNCGIRMESEVLQSQAYKHYVRKCNFMSVCISYAMFFDLSSEHASKDSAAFDSG